MTDWNEDFTDDNNGVDEGPDDETDADLLDDNSELVPCQHCGTMISEYAQKCPACGDWIVEGQDESALTRRPMWWIILAVAGIIMFVILYAIF
ncbi:MAG: hypothetical protein KAR11_07020 [Phycisphaerae bacterium]|nr:hypothetical protein [Phycisphaerae bacterium]